MSSNAPRFEVVVETPMGSRVKYERDIETGALWRSRRLQVSYGFPADYGYFPYTLAGDGDPLDAVVLTEDPVVPGCHLFVRVLGVLFMHDEGLEDDKIICVPADDPRYDAFQRLEDVNPARLAELEDFFSHYKHLDKAAPVIAGTASVEKALELLETARNAVGR